MLSSKNETVFFLSDMPMLGLFNYRKFVFFSTPESVDVFQVVKFFALQMLWVLETLFELFLERNFSRNSARVQNYSNCLSVFEMNLKCFPSSKFEPRSFAKCLQNLLIEKKSVERLWRFSKGWTYKIGNVCREMTFKPSVLCSDD
jgi:hypothetical protein